MFDNPPDEEPFEQCPSWEDVHTAIRVCHQKAYETYSKGVRDEKTHFYSNEEDILGIYSGGANLRMIKVVEHIILQLPLYTQILERIKQKYTDAYFNPAGT